jgi:hypothetical protein
MKKKPADWNEAIRESQIPTPSFCVNKLLDMAYYRVGDDILGKKFLENSCGEGNIACAAVKRYIIKATAQKIDKISIRRMLERDFVFFEIDESVAGKCLGKLNALSSSYGVENVHWAFNVDDFLDSPINQTFDFIIGNPPYISYFDMPVWQREKYKKDFKTCAKGKFDICYAFLEKSVSLLSENGIVSYLIPNSLFKNSSGAEIRAICNPKLVSVAINFPKVIFKKVTISSSIIILSNSIFQKDTIDIFDDGHGKKAFPKAMIQGKWSFLNNGSPKRKQTRFGDFFDVFISPVTQLNSAYVFEDNRKNESDPLIIPSISVEIENGIIRPAASPCSEKKKQKKAIIYPYDQNGSPYSEDFLKINFPKAFSYLLSKKTDLEGRDKDDRAKWFEFGRNQGLKKINCRKLLVSTIITKKVHVFELNKLIVPFSGVVITASKKDFPLWKARAILSSKRFFRYVQSVGIESNGRSRRISSRDISDFRFSYWANR